MKLITKDDLKKLQLDILDAVTKYCEENNIAYWLDCGTLLGAIRHNGYIPWDDDIDIGMLRPDYERFIFSFGRTSTRYVVKCIENDPNCFYPFAKVLDMNTILYEPDENGSKLCVNIDVFPYDNAPVEDRKLRSSYNRRDFYTNCNQLRIWNNKPNGNVFRRILVYFLRLIVKPFPKTYFVKKVVHNAKKYNKNETGLVGNFTSYTRITCAKRVFNGFIYHLFENKEYKIPVGYDEWLRSFYGDYMKLPPKEKQVSHHRFKAFYKD